MSGAAGDGGAAGAGGEQVGMVGHTSSLPLPMHQLVLVGCATQPLKMRLFSLH